MPATDTQVRVFISHKPEDYQAAHRIAEAMQVLGEGRLDAFVAEDPGQGFDFFTTRLTELAQADTLIFLYTDPTQDCNLCVYETGFFSGRSFPNRNKRLVVMHDEDLRIPHPLAFFDHVAVSKDDRTDVEHFIRDLFAQAVRDGVDPIQPEIMSDKWKKFRTVLEDTIIDAVSGPQETKVFVSEIAIEVPEQSLRQTMEAGKSDMPDDAVVIADRASFALFGLQESPRGYSWRLFYEHMDRNSDNTQEWADSLVGLIAALAFSPRLQPTTGLPLYRFRQGANTQCYRPAVRSFRRKKDTLTFRVVFVDLPPETILEGGGAAASLAQALTLGRMFRWGVLWQFRDSLDSLETRVRLQPDLDTSAALAQEYARFLENTLTVYVESKNRGYQREELDRHFDQNGSRRTLDGLYQRWDMMLAGTKDLLDKFKHGEAGINEARQVVNEAIDINKQFMLLCAQRYKEVIEEW